MAEYPITVDTLPPPYRDGFVALANTLRVLAGENLLGLCAFGGWLAGDPFFAGTPGRSVVVLRRIDLRMLDRLATSGAKFGRRNLRAPLIMTPEYVRSSCDTFPLELLEIQQTHVVVCGADYFADLRFEPRHVRLQCEREFKSELIQLRQGLLAAAGRRKLLGTLCLDVAERTLRVLRGVLYLADASQTAGPSAALVRQVAAHTRLGLPALERLVAGRPEIGLPEFEALYQDIAQLAGYIDELPTPAASAP